MEVVFTKHALERMEQRAVSKEMVLQAINKPNRTYPEDDGDTKFIRRVNGVQLHVVCKPLPEEGKWLVKSTWVRGEDARQRPSTYRRSSSHRSRGFNWLGLAVLIIVIAIYLLTRGV